MSFKMDREEYAQHYGPTVGDSVRLGITDLLKGNGYLAVYIAGMMVGNNKIMHRDRKSVV